MAGIHCAGCLVVWLASQGGCEQSFLGTVGQREDRGRVDGIIAGIVRRVRKGVSRTRDGESSVILSRLHIGGNIGTVCRLIFPQAIEGVLERAITEQTVVVRHNQNNEVDRTS
ncbi:hypothetical protein BJY04DRAFT_184505 [Aspergillus karnatakaensis]|uniref:uncharacterized protein n=1 Tax=Aspergillus karnatakaensis TaxID=1810916 RepID=UPI003CCCF505